MDVSIIIVNYRTKKLLENCIDSIIKYTKNINYEIIIIDNNSEDGFPYNINNRSPKIKTIKSSQNLGFGKANNLGSQYAQGKYLFYLNSDTLLKNNAIKYFYDYAESSTDKLGALGSILYGLSGETCHSYGKFITTKTELKESISRYLRFLKDHSIFHPKEIRNPIEVEYITGADLFVPKKVFDDTNGFDPDYFMYCEEVDWQKRMANLKLKRIIIPGPQIIHLEGGSDPTQSSLWNSKRLKNLTQSKKLYYKKHFNKKMLRIFYIVKFLIDLPWKILLKILYIYNK